MQHIEEKKEEFETVPPDYEVFKRFLLKLF